MELKTKKTPITLILGNNEISNKAISYRKFGLQDTFNKIVDDFIKKTVISIEKNIIYEICKKRWFNFQRFIQL